MKRKISTIMLTALLALSSLGTSNAVWKDYKPYGGFDSSWKRFYGVDRIKTAEYTANSLNPHKDKSTVYQLKEGQGVPTVLVNYDSFRDGLSAYNLCKAFNARLLLIKPNYANIGLMKNYYKSKVVYLLGSEKEIALSTENYIKRFMPGTKVVRIGDSDPYQRNLETLKIAGLKEVAVADGRQFPDALSASGLCNNKNLGLMLVDGSKDYTLPQGLSVKYTVGGSNSVSKDAGTRLAGDNRYSTAKEIARATSGYSNIIFVDGTKFPDSISAINLVKPRNSIILPINNTRDNSDMKEFLSILPPEADEDSWDIEKEGYALVVGGHNSLSDKTVTKMLYPSK